MLFAVQIHSHFKQMTSVIILENNFHFKDILRVLKISQFYSILASDKIKIYVNYYC